MVVVVAVRAFPIAKHFCGFASCLRGSCCLCFCLCFCFWFSSPQRPRPTSRAPSRKLPMYNPQCIPQIENMISWPTGSVLAFNGHQDALHLSAVKKPRDRPSGSQDSSDTRVARLEATRTRGTPTAMQQSRPSPQAASASHKPSQPTHAT